MLRPLIQRPRRRAVNRPGERGVTLALVALAIVSIIAMAGLSIDVGTLYQASAEAQRSADQAALAAARVLSLSGMTGDPTNSTGKWSAACAAATQIATAVAKQNNVGGKAPSSVNITFFSSDTSNCSSTSGAFGVNPMVQLQVVQASLPTYFSRIWGRTGSSVSATATAEVFNPSNSASHTSSGNLVPVQPRCVKPMIVPNLDPGNPSGCNNVTGPPCQKFVNDADGSIVKPGIGSGVIGDRFDLVADCGASPGNCRTPGPGPQTFNNPPGVPVPGNLSYLPGQVLGTPVAVPSCGNANTYQEALAGCDQSTPYQCGVQYASLSSPNEVDLSENPAPPPENDTSTAMECLIHQASGGTITGQDFLDTTVYPYQIQAGTANPLNVSGKVITSSNSIVSIPIYDGTPLVIKGNLADVTIVGFLQVFINQVNAGVNGSVNVTVLNVAGCGNAVSSSALPLTGTSPVPVRLITPPPP